MPLYDFICKECNIKTEFFRGMNEKKPEDCPECGCKTCLVRDFSGINVVEDMSKPKTIGAIADANTEKLVKEGKLDKKVLDWRDNKKKKQEKVSRMNEIVSMTQSQKRNYIFTGRKNG